ncbi:SMC-Scp complex subunit ScpB [Micromonospora sp. NBC_00389]|uniref:SMC-Scp complex subunit ScpB n=1 Tax=Micromonospora sp. NBC_00389 TaxID=2903586 RepID=UPI002E1AA02A
MSDEERQDSLADQAAAWVPPWERPRPPAPTSPEADEDPAAELPPETSVTTPTPAAEDRGGQPPLQGPEFSKISAESDEFGVADEPAEPIERDEAAERDASSEPDATETSAVAGADEAKPRQPDEAGEGEAGAAVGESGAGDVPHRLAAGRRRAPVVPEPAPELSDAELRGALEAILLVVDEPVSELILAQVLEQPAERVGPMLDEIAAGYTAAGHGFELRRAAGGWRLYTRPEYATYVERFVLDGQSVRLTQAALETLAVVAYKQPVTRSRISAIRGVNCDGVIRTLVTRGLVEECGAEPDSGAFLYRTTTLFLEKLGLNTVDELPPLAPFLPDDVEELADATR